MVNKESANFRVGLKSHRLAIFLLTGISVLLMLILSIGLTMNPRSTTSALINQPAKDFRVSRLQGVEYLPNPELTSFALDDLKGKPLILNFWASWCVSCREEALEFERFWQKNKDKGILVVGIAIQDEAESALNFARTFGKTYILGLDENGRASIDYGVAGVPETFFIDKAGIIRHKHTGPITNKELQTYLNEIL